MPESKRPKAEQAERNDVPGRGGIKVGPATAEGIGRSSPATGSGTAQEIVVVFNEVEPSVNGPAGADASAPNEYNILCASEYGSKQSGTKTVSTPAPQGTVLPFSQTPIYARVTAHVSKEVKEPAKCPMIEAVNQGHAPSVYSIVAPPLNTTAKGTSASR